LKESAAGQVPLQLHLVQVYLDQSYQAHLNPGYLEGTAALETEAILRRLGDRPVEKDGLEQDALEKDALEKDALEKDALEKDQRRLKWYRDLLTGVSVRCLGRPLDSLPLLRASARRAQSRFGDKSAENLRAHDELLIALIESGKNEEAKAVFVKITELLNAQQPGRTPRSLSLTAYREAGRYLELKRVRAAIWLLSWSKELHAGKAGAKDIGVARRLYMLSRAYGMAGDREKMHEALQAARAISPVDPSIKSE
jgi:hypothetical protein